jgi:tetratricopeptide (TPR) repeat protein
MKIRVLLAFSLFSMALFGGGAVALGQPGADEPGPTNEDQAARLLFQSAREAFAVGEYERALSGFQQAYDLSRRPALLYNIGTTFDRLRRDDEALAIFEQFLREDPETPNRAEIESRVAQLRAGIQARHAREEAARLEAERVDAERRAAEEERRLAEEHRRLAEEAASGGTPPVLVISVGGVAVATGAMALGFGLRTRALDDSYENYVATTLEENGGVMGDPDQVREARDRYNRAKSRQTLTNTMLGISGAALIGAVTLIFFTDWDGDDPDAAPADTARLTPSLGVSAQGVEMGMTYDF